MLSTILIVLLILLLIGALPSWPYSAEWGYAPGGVLGTVLVVFVISRWRKHALEPVAGAGTAVAISQELLERARARAARETED